MAPRISLALTLHNHQPIGNFGWVMAAVHDQAYKPMLDALDRHPGVRVGLHYTGPLLDWLAAERPEFIVRLRRLIDRGQVELLGGGLYEPILISLPAADRREQLERMAQRVVALTGAPPRGAWLAERVWEPSLPASIAAAGYDWTILDDAHFHAAALPDEASWGAWRTEDQGQRITVFGTEQGLRYRIPFGKVQDVIDHLRRHATEDGERLGTMGDDGEKFGAWPTTYEHCWGPGRWVDDFFDALEANVDWLTTITPSRWLDGHLPRGLAYVPAGSYAEMGEWALPADESRPFAALLHGALDAGRQEARWLRGASWRNFQVKYREANDLHKQMLRASRTVHAMPPGPAREAALDHLHRGQSNDCYWHGLFGGLYLADLRVAALRHLIAAQDAAAAAGGYAPVAKVVDLDSDGRDDVLLADRAQVVTVDLDEGAGIGAWDVRAARHPLAAVLRRRPEAYHETLRAMEVKAAEEAAAHEAAARRAEDAGLADAAHPVEPARPVDAALPGGASVRDPGAPASIHEIVVAKERNLSAKLLYDDHERRLGLVRFFTPAITPPEAASGSGLDLGDFVAGAFEVARLEPGLLATRRDGTVRSEAGRPAPVRVEKTIRIGGERCAPHLDLELAVENRSDEPVTARIGLELPTMLLGGGGNPSAWWDVDGQRSGHDAAGSAPGITAIGQGNDHIGISVATAVEPASDAWWSPIETVSNSESGFERAYQGSSLLLSWARRLAPGERFSAVVHNQVTVAVDLAAEESAASGSWPPGRVPARRG